MALNRVEADLLGAEQGIAAEEGYLLVQGRQEAGTHHP